MFAQLGYYICVPFAWLTRLFYTWTGSYGVALILFTLLVKLVLLPFQLKSKKSMLRMSRLGITVSTKLGHAVVRNRVRRRLRELYRLHRQEMLPGYDLIVVARVRAVEMPYAKLEKQYLRCLAQLGLLREDV